MKARKDMDPRYQWRLDHIFATEQAYENAYAAAQAAIEHMASWQGKVASDPKEAILEADRLSLTLDHLAAYALMHKDEDSGDPERQSRAARFQSLAVKADAATSFLDPELLAMPEETLQALASDPMFSDYSEMLRILLLQKPHTLPAEQEMLLAEAGDVMSVPSDVFGMFNNVDLPLPQVSNDQGEKMQLTHGNYGPLIRSQNRAVRKEAFEGMMGTYQRFGSTLTAMYGGAVKRACFLAKARHYASARQAALAPKEIPESVYDNLLASVEDALPALTEYLRIRKEKLGVEELHLYDLYVPIIGDYDMKLTYEEAFELVCEGLAPLGEEYISKLREGYANGWIDVYENKNKRSGAYSWGCYGVHPYVLLNHTDDLGGAMTIAHELGHSMHTFYSNQAQPFVKSNYSLFVAEVASTCNEVLLMRHLMKKHADDPKAAAFLCNQLLEEFRTTVFRQTMFAAFEKEAHAMYERGEALTSEALSQMYFKLNEKYYGGGSVVDELISAEWMRIPHFYRNFYVYQYATGFSAAVAIATRILKEGEPAVKDYKKFLSAGCSVPPIEALRFAGVDMEKPDAVKDAMQVFADTVEELKKLL
ncbi:MAG: oligoendopeptidase F [Clostridia bacterium]|nr:oligoendopeptidase F [Clostridia bacterium]MBR0407756.1 oligoendopeptidase F [Clostridia bacterium]